MTDARVRLQQAENVLLHWDDDALLPTCKLSDFGNATSDSYHVERRESPLCSPEGAPAYCWGLLARGIMGTCTHFHSPQAEVPARSSTRPPRPSSRRRTRASSRLLTGRPTCGHSASCCTSCAISRCRTRAPRVTTRRKWRTRSNATAGALLRRPYFHPSRSLTSYCSWCPHRSFHPLAPFPPAASARHDIPPSLLALLQALINRTPTRRPLCDRVSRAIEDVRAELKRGWRPVEHAGQGEEVVLAAPRGGRWTAGHSFGGVPLWRPQRERGVGRLESVQPGDGRVEVEVEVEEPESRDDGEWRLSPPLQVRLVPLRLPCLQSRPHRRPH